MKTIINSLRWTAQKVGFWGKFSVVTALITIVIATIFASSVNTVHSAQFNLQIAPGNYLPVTNSPISFKLPSGEKIRNMSMHRSFPGDVYATAVDYIPPIECFGQDECTIQTTNLVCGLYTITVTTSNRNEYEGQFTLYTSNPAVRIESPRWQAVFTKGEEMLVTWRTLSMSPQADKWNVYLVNPNDFGRTEPVGGNPVLGTNCTFILPASQIDQVQGYWLKISSSQTNYAQDLQVASATRSVTVDSNPTVKPRLAIDVPEQKWVRLKIEDTKQVPGRTFWYETSNDSIHWSPLNEGFGLSDGAYVRSDWYKNQFFRVVEVR